jgi:hypothetical protein
MTTREIIRGLVAVQTGIMAQLDMASRFLDQAGKIGEAAKTGWFAAVSSALLNGNHKPSISATICLLIESMGGTYMGGESTDSFRKELESLINRHSKENGSNTPDFILAQYLDDCLGVFDKTVRHREQWYGRNPQNFEPGPAPADPPSGEPPAQPIKSVLGAEHTGDPYD